ncbi:MAG: hypothetical protein ACJ76J_23660 [Thermoanaerobaculia bacterium]
MRKSVAVAILLLLCARMSASATVLAEEPPQPPQPPAAPRSLQITSQVKLPPELNRARDLRWASDNSVYLALGANGVSEVSLNPPNQQIREMVPGRFKPGGFIVSNQLAVSSQYLVAAGFGIAFTWRRLADATRSEDAVDYIQAVDVWNDRLLLVGGRRDDQGFATDGAIAWTGSLDKKLADLKPVLYAASGSGAREMNACGSVHLGAARFFEDGSFLIFPGVQPGLGLYDREGKLQKTWDTASLGLYIDCSSLSPEAITQIKLNYPARMAWINQRRTVDTILMLPQGPGLVIRGVENGRVQWQLHVLTPAGQVITHQLPIEAPDEFYHLRGDTRSGKLVFLLFQTPPSDNNYPQPYLITALAPEG